MKNTITIEYLIMPNTAHTYNAINEQYRELYAIVYIEMIKHLSELNPWQEEMLRDEDVDFKTNKVVFVYFSNKRKYEYVNKINRITGRINYPMTKISRNKLRNSLKYYIAYHTMDNVSYTNVGRIFSTTASKVRNAIISISNDVKYSESNRKNIIRKTLSTFNINEDGIYTKTREEAKAPTETKESLEQNKIHIQLPIKEMAQFKPSNGR